MQWIADRFFRTDGAWIDAASGHAVRLRLLPAAQEDQLAWNDECARLSLLRHPLLNALVDYGSATRRLLFEAFEPGEAVHATTGAGSAERLLRQVTEFLRSHEITMPPDRAVHAMRAVMAGSGAPRRPVGLTLQGRKALCAIEEVLDEMSPAGTVVVTVAGAPHTGLRTLRCLAARAARVRGLVVSGAPVMARFPPVRALVGARHVCLLDDVAAPGRTAAGVSGVLSDLSLASARRHVVVRFHRDASRARRIALDPLDPARLVAMVFRDGDEPGEAELRAAARESHGLPGAFVARLCGGAYPAPAAAPLLVHETSPAYRVETTAREPAVIAGRVLGAALRAPDRAFTLARRGRHAAARRLLERAVRVLEGRDRRVESARCQIQLGLMALDRGATSQARTRFERARTLDADAGIAVEATIGVGVALTDERRLVEGEAVLRGAVAAADTLQDRDRAATAAAALARCLFWQGRQDEAIATASAHLESQPGPAAAARLLAVRARAQTRLGRTALAVRTARDAQQVAGQADPRAQSSADLALAEALAGGGDIEGARAAVARATRLARQHHQPLQRIRGLLLASSCGVPGAVRAVRRLRRLPLPALLADRLARAAEPPARPVEPVTIVEQLLDLSQRAVDDGAAMTAICAAAAERLRASTVSVFGADERVLASQGRSWPTPALIVQQLLAQGSHVSRMAAEPQEAAEPIRYGGETIGVLACRWTAGTLVDAEGAAVFMRAAALTLAPHLRACLEDAPLPPAAWGELIGESLAALELRESVKRAARAPFPVLIEGESGCGKELVARAIHRLGPRGHRRFCALNCAALTDELVETELFGHVRGAFTGAAGERAGLFEEADGGTLFLDEVGELSPRAQAKLLRVVQEGEVRRVGENLPRKVDVRVVAATNRQIADEVRAGRFRADLRFRLDVVRIVVPPLRVRAGDVPLLAAHFWRDATARVGSRAALSKEALALLSRYDWPGNVRELQNVIAWIAVHSPRRGRVGASALPAHVAQSTTGPHISFEAARQDFERRFVRAALAGANGQRARAAEVLGVTRQGLAKMMKRLSIEG
jgi:transcriptional regulator with AAA-type ATPase domain